MFWLFVSIGVLILVGLLRRVLMLLVQAKPKQGRGFEDRARFR
jgi:cytochrome b561